MLFIVLKRPAFLHKRSITRPDCFPRTQTIDECRLTGKAATGSCKMFLHLEQNTFYYCHTSAWLYFSLVRKARGNVIPAEVLSTQVRAKNQCK